MCVCVCVSHTGDDTQRQLGVLQHVKPSKLSRIFITRLAPETLLGLPGLLCTVSAARVKGHEKTDLPLHIYGPRGLADYLDTIFKVRDRLHTMGLRSSLNTHLLPQQPNSTSTDDQAGMFACPLLHDCHANSAPEHAQISR